MTLHRTIVCSALILSAAVVVAAVDATPVVVFDEQGRNGWTPGTTAETATTDKARSGTTAVFNNGVPNDYGQIYFDNAATTSLQGNTVLSAWVYFDTSVAGNTLKSLTRVDFVDIGPESSAIALNTGNCVIKVDGVPDASGDIEFAGGKWEHLTVEWTDSDASIKDAIAAGVKRFDLKFHSPQTTPTAIYTDDVSFTTPANLVAPGATTKPVIP